MARRMQRRRMSTGDGEEARTARATRTAGMDAAWVGLSASLPDERKQPMVMR